MAKFEIGNKEAEKWTEEEAIELFLSIRELCKDSNINSLQDAILKANHYHSGYYYLLKKYPVLDSIKEDSQNIIIAGVNQKALDGTFNPTASICTELILKALLAIPLNDTRAFGLRP